MGADAREKAERRAQREHLARLQLPAPAHLQALVRAIPGPSTVGTIVIAVACDGTFVFATKNLDVPSTARTLLGVAASLAPAEKPDNTKTEEA